ncbi:hypothetical protein FOA52_005976 [Chlamydomonas sp. UWO 241]|nr:hypothetical protein FOA52_005976 [Chlamydomonas sp. UWO 241]
MASPFGTGFSFGAKPAAGFGTPQPQQASTGFGAAPNSAAPAFGAPAPSIFGSSTPAFSFGGAPANTSPSLFGASPAPAFGAPASTGGGLFSGGSVPVGAFGAAPSTPSLGFGAAAAPAFGATASPFGSTAIGAAAPATGAFSFAAPAAGAPSPFGAPAAASPSPFGFAPSLAGTAMQQQQQQQMAGAVALSSSFGPDAATKEIGEVRAAYTPSSSTYKFQHLFLNVVDNPGSRVKPANVDEMRWRQVLAQAGGPSNPEHLWPVQAVGFKDLLARAAAQQYAISENQERLRSLTELGHKMQRHHAGDLKTRTADVQKRHIELSARLLHVTRLLDALEARLAGSLGYRGDAAKVVWQCFLPTVVQLCLAN